MWRQDSDLQFLEVHHRQLQISFAECFHSPTTEPPASRVRWNAPSQSNSLIGYHQGNPRRRERSAKQCERPPARTSFRMAWKLFGSPLFPLPLPPENG